MKLCWMVQRGGNPFIDVRLSARFTHSDETIEVPGFYDGKGKYRIRFMPTREGKWSYRTTSSAQATDRQDG